MPYPTRRNILAALVSAAAVPAAFGRGGPVDARPADAIPEKLRGYWSLIGVREHPLPDRFANYRLELGKTPGECRLYLDKGLSRGILAKSAELVVEVGRPSIVFEKKGAWTFRASFAAKIERGPIEGRLVVKETDGAGFEGTIHLVEARPVR